MKLVSGQGKPTERDKFVSGQGKVQIGNSGSREAIMDSNGSGRRRFLKHAAALAGVAAGTGAGAEWARGQSAKSAASAKLDVHSQDSNDHPHLLRPGATLSLEPTTHYLALSDYRGSN